MSQLCRAVGTIAIPNFSRFTSCRLYKPGGKYLVYRLLMEVHMDI